MTTIPSNTCPQCGMLIPEDSVHGLCPRCVFAKALAPTADGGFVSYVPPSLESVRAAFPHLEITVLIGSGGMGAVFKARQPQLDRFVALKILPAELAGQPGFSERFQREAQVLARLSHPHIVTVHDFGRAGDFYFLLMEFIDGVNLRQLLQTKRLTPKEALSIVPPICEALQCAHDHGIVHRDIKPENLLIDKAGTVKIADFGIAKIVDGSDALRRVDDGAAGVSTDGKSPAPSMPFGTPDYAAPEQASGSADHRADIYSLGVVLYEMLTGERPTDKLEAPSKRVQVDVRIDEIVLRALEKSPELRFATAAEFRTSVESLEHPLPQVKPLSQGGAGLWLRAVGVFVVLFVSLSVVLAAIRYNSPLGTNELLALVALSLGIAWWTLRRREPALKAMWALGVIACLIWVASKMELASSQNLGRSPAKIVHANRPSAPTPDHELQRAGVAKAKTDKQPNEVPFKGEPKLRYIAWMPKDESGWQLRTPGGEAVTAPGDIPVSDWEWWKKGLLENGTASKISDTSGWLMFFYSHPAIDQRSESRVNLFTPAGEKIKVTQRVSGAREPKAPNAAGWLATGCRVPYAAAQGQLKASLALTAGSWWSSEPVTAGKTNNTAGGQFLTNSGEDASHRAFVTVVTEDEDKFPYYQWEVLGRLRDGSDMRSVGSTAVNFQSQYVHTISFGLPLSSYAGFIVRSRERKTFVNDGVHAPPVLVEAPESDSNLTLQMRWVRDSPSVNTEVMMFTGPRQSETLNIEKAVLLDQSALQSVEAIHWPTGSQIALQFTESGKQRFAQATREGKGQRLAIIIDGQVRSAPMIQVEISDGRAEISGNLSHEEADDLAARLRASTDDKTTDSYHESTKAARNEHRLKIADLLLKADRAVIFLLDFDIVSDRRLRRLAPSQSGLDLVPDSKFPIYPMGTAANVLDRKTLTAQQLAPLLPHLAQAVRHDEGGHDWCHAPIHGLRLYRGNEEIFESSFCWVCSTFTLLYPDHSDLHPVHDEGLQQLMEQLMPIPAKEMERFKAKWPNLFLFRAPDEVMTQLRSDLTVLMELPSSFALGPDDVEAALSDIHAEIRRQPKAFEYTREELAAFRKDECPYADTDIEKAFAKLQADAGGRPLPELIVFYRTKFTAGSLTPRQKTICFRMVSAALLEAVRTPAKP